jgi:hypothetical protein
MAGRLMAAAGAAGASGDARSALIRGAVGDGAGVEFVAGAVRRKLRPRFGMAQAFHSRTHQITVFTTDARTTFRRGIVGMCRYPIQTRLGEQANPSLPITGVKEFGLPVEKLFDFVL